MRIPLVQGRGFDERDRVDSAPVVIVNETLAETVWPGENPVGKTILMEWGKDIAAEVVGVAGDVRLSGLDTAARATLYWPLAQFPNDFMTLVVRAKGGTSIAEADLRARLSTIDPDIPVSSIVSMEGVVSRSLGKPRLTLSLMSIFGAVALLLASVGIYGVISFTVNQRVHEFGLRMALGASARNIEGMVLRQGLALALLRHRSRRHRSSFRGAPARWLALSSGAARPDDSPRHRCPSPRRRARRELCPRAARHADRPLRGASGRLTFLHSCIDALAGFDSRVPSRYRREIVA